MIWRLEEFVRGNPGSEKGLLSDDLDKAAAAEFDVIMREDLGQRQAHDWKMPLYKPLGSDLGEIRFNSRTVPYRIYGSMSGLTFRAWLTATKDRKRSGKQDTRPPDAIKKARKRKADFEKHGLGKLQQYDL